MLMFPENLLNIQQTPLEHARGLTDVFGLDIDLRIKRDDLYPQTGGGSKSRKIIYIFRKAICDGYDAFVTNGGPQSNHARATAILSASLGLKCHLVIVVDPSVSCSVSGNLLLMKMSGASIEYCTKDKLAETMDEAVLRISEQGFRPLYIWGGGHSIIGLEAFIEAAKEVQAQSGTWIPDYVILASGTGSTQAGLIIGYADLPTTIIGVSVARDAIRGTKVINDLIHGFLNQNKLVPREFHVDFRDEWKSGGYEIFDSKALEIISKAAKVGYYFDPTYTGKAFNGLVSMVNNHEIPSGSRVLFWHTGGIMNLLASKTIRNYYHD